MGFIPAGQKPASGDPPILLYRENAFYPRIFAEFHHEGLSADFHCENAFYPQITQIFADFFCFIVKTH
jgi:hypothetical protein